MKICASCKKEVEIDHHFSRKAICPMCSGDLHACLNCRFYSEKSHNKCLEPKAEFQRSRDKANFCDYFIFRETSDLTSADRATEEARKRLENLFKK
ncbi:MAG: hypothetical protein HY755_12425 [Nitrospirae bacterium]|nr:hypothetical protein [Nitrospirota bacterium]